MPVLEQPPEERRIVLHRHASLPAIELMVQREAPRLSLYSTDFALIVPGDWVGTATYRSKSHRLAPGRVLLVEPGEVVASSECLHAGTFRVLLLGPGLVHAQVAARHASGHQIEATPGSVRVSQALAERMARAFQSMEAPVPPAGTELVLEALLAALAEEIFRPRAEPTPSGKRDPDARGRMAERLRDTLRRGALVDEPAPSLEVLSSQLGMSRFQVLRLFRRHYGVTPHAYLLHFRVALAQRSLRSGHPLAEVAASFGFVDQSHFTKQFKRLVGITPGQYARPR